MKKRVFAAVVTAVIMLVVMTATAFAAGAPTVSLDNANPKVGDRITYTITSNDEALTGNVSVSGNLQYDGFEGGLSASEGSFALGAGGAMSVQYHYIVKAGSEGQSFTFTITGAVGANGNPVERTDYTNIDGQSGTVAAAPEPPAAVSKAALVTALGNAEAERVGINQSDDGNMLKSKQWVTPKVWNTFNSAIASAAAVNTNASATQAQVDAAVSALNSAVTAFNNAKAWGTRESGSGSGAAATTTTAASNTGLDDVPNTSDSTGGIWAVSVMSAVALTYIGFLTAKKALLKK